MNQAHSTDHIAFDHVEVKYSEYVYGLRDVSLSIHKGEFVFFLGQTGSGKSTLLKLLTREVRPTAGTVHLWGRDISHLPEREVPSLRRQMGIVPQDYGLLPRKRVYENVAYALRAIGTSRKETRERVPEILERVHIGHRADAYPHQLSGGEQQRVAIGRALINNPPLLIADEPTGNLDPDHSWEIMELLLELNLRGTTVMVASHDLMVVERVGRRIVTMQQGRIIDDMTPEAETLQSIVEHVESEMEAEQEAVHRAETPHIEEPEPPEEPDIDFDDVVFSMPSVGVEAPEQQEEPHA